MYVLINPDGYVHGIWKCPVAGEKEVYDTLRSEGIPEDELEDYASDWVLYGPFEPVLE